MTRGKIGARKEQEYLKIIEAFLASGERFTWTQLWTYMREQVKKRYGRSLSKWTLSRYLTNLRMLGLVLRDDSGRYSLNEGGSNIGFDDLFRLARRQASSDRKKVLRGDETVLELELAYETKYAINCLLERFIRTLALLAKTHNESIANEVLKFFERVDVEYLLGTLARRIRLKTRPWAATKEDGYSLARLSKVLEIAFRTDLIPAHEKESVFGWCVDNFIETARHIEEFQYSLPTQGARR